MNDHLFENIDGLDSEYLDAAYGNDADTASMVFEQFLQEYPANLAALEQSFSAMEVESFGHHIHKQKPGFSYVGLTDVTQKFHELQTKCTTRNDLITYRDEIEKVLERIRSAESILRNTLVHLQDIQ